MSCCSNENDKEGCCCDKNRDNSICICLPYVDGFMIAAQVISIIAFLISWLWWVTFVVGLICLVLLQLLWCCRQNKIGLYISAGISALAGVTCTIAGIVMIIVWKDQAWCSIFTLTDGYSYYDDYSNYSNDYCSEESWAVAAFVTAVLWFSTTGCILYFIKSGRHAKWEEKVRGANSSTSPTAATPTAIEMGTVQHHQHDDHQQEQLTTAGTVSIATATASASATDHDRTTCSTADSYVLPEISNKVDDV